jgi:hypothetical protein
MITVVGHFRFDFFAALRLCVKIIAKGDLRRCSRKDAKPQRNPNKESAF